MESPKRLPKKRWLLYPAAAVLCFTIAFLSYFLTNDRRNFKRLTEDLFCSEFAEDTLSLHYTLADPGAYGLSYTPTLPCYRETSADDSTGLFSALNRLYEISPEKLSDEDAFAYRLLKGYLELQLKGSAFPYYDEPLSPSSGMHSSLPILLADYTFRTKKDVEDYLTLLDQTDTYFEGLALYEQEKASAGLFMSDLFAEKVISGCDAIMDRDALANETHFLQETFNERVSALKDDGVISENEKAAFLSENDRLLITVMQPAYEELGDTLLVLKGSGSNTMGLYYLPEGKSYYEYLLARSTGSSRSVSEIKELLYTDFQSNYAALLSLIREYPDLTDFAEDAEALLSFESSAEILSDLQKRMAGDFPSLPSDGLSPAPSCRIKSVSKAMEDYSSPAYYLTPPIDDTNNNTIYINHKNMPDSLTLYTTLAHEGYPGHLYQTVYSQLDMKNKNTSCIRYLLHYGGYAEGWALYTENLAYEYAKQFAPERPEAAAWYEACRLNRNIQLCMYSLLDIAIHDEGATPEEVQKILKRIGITSPESVQNIYQYIVAEPCNYPKYYVGYLEFNELQKKARSLWGDDFSLQKFHQFILETGPCDFASLESRL